MKHPPEWEWSLMVAAAITILVMTIMLQNVVDSLDVIWTLAVIALWRIGTALKELKK